MRKIILLTSFFLLTPVVLFTSIVYLSYLSYVYKGRSLFGNHISKVAFAALPSLENVIINQVNQQDARTEIVRQFFQKYASPLEPFAKNIIDASDKYKLDFRLLPAIAMQESNLCHKIISNSHNCWGFGIYGKKITKFDDYAQAIDTVTKTLALEYKEERGLDTPKEIMTRYTPTNNGSWATSVSYFMSTLQ